MGAPAVEDENFCLRWNDYEKKYAETFRTLREDDHFADVTLACEGHAVKAHRIILCACSSYFSHILRTINPVQHPVLLLQDVRPVDLTALMDFIYFGQVNITQDSLQTFLKVADKLKIKGLCERGITIPEASPLHTTITLPRKDEVKHDPTSILPHNNFEGLLPRTPYLQNPPTQVVCVAQTLPTLSRHTTSSGAPPAHQSPKHSRPPAAPRPPEQYMIISSPKKAKYSIGPQHASILRNQLVTSKDLYTQGGNAVEVKSEPMAMISSHQEELPPSSVATVTEYITTEGDLTLPPLPHGMSPQFMFPSDPGAGDPGAIAPQPAALVTIQPEKETVTSVAGYTSRAYTSGTRVLSVSVPGPAAPTATPVPGELSPAPQTPTHHTHHHHQPMDDGEPQDLTPMQDVGSHQTVEGGIGTPGSTGQMSSPDGQTPKKDRNARKQCPYCHKDFHEMSLKRHIKDVHFRNQNTYVICPQCCKQYASQNSLYSHLNRVHGVKKEEIQLMSAAHDSGHDGIRSITHDGIRAITHDGSHHLDHSSGEVRIAHLQTVQVGGDNNHDGHDGHDGIRAITHDGIRVVNDGSHHDGIMDLAQHSDHSN